MNEVVGQPVSFMRHPEHVKAQWLRLANLPWGVLVAWAGWKATNMPKWARAVMIVGGLGTTIYNGMNWAVIEAKEGRLPSWVLDVLPDEEDMPNHLRLLDVFLLGPVVVWFALKGEGLPGWVRTTLVLTGVGLSVFNWNNYRMIEQGQLGQTTRFIPTLTS